MVDDGDHETVADTVPRARTGGGPTNMPPERYRMLEEIGVGGMGRVYRAHDTSLGRDVAVKLIEGGALHAPGRTMQRERFVREARAAARVMHPNIAIIHDVDPEAGWLVMELVDGESVRARADRGPLAPDLVASIAAQVLSALDAAHANGIIHRDIKPSNIMLASGDRVKLVDFGVARLVDVDMTVSGARVGTPAYMAPEQIRNTNVDERADLYSLGATLYELVTGERVSAFEPLGAEEAVKLAQACTGQPTLAPFITRCLYADPAGRFPSARDALAALEGRTQSPRTSSARWFWIGAAAVAVLGGAVAGVMVGHHRSAPQRDPQVEKAFVLAQRGENDKALQILADYLAKHRDDADVQTIAFLAKWWQGTTLDDAKRRIVDLPLRPAQRAMINGIDLITQKRNPEAIAYLEAADRETPNSVEILYVLGEAQWHGQHLDDGVKTLESAFALDPRWEMALHHVEEYRLSRGETSELRGIADRLRTTDGPAAAALDCKIAISERDYPHAVSSAKAALANAKLEKIPELYLCLAQAQALTGDLDTGAATAKTAFDMWPVEARDDGGFAQYAEFFLYRGELEAYFDLVRGRPSSQRAIAILVQKPAMPVNEPQPEWPRSRMPPLGAATWMLQQFVHNVDASNVVASYPEPEVRAWGLALAAEARGDKVMAIARLREALAAPAKGDIRMLVAHRLAKLLHESGDAHGAAEACDEVIRPRLYLNYRAVLLPDCKQWTATTP